jgi:hypothetical protein
MTMRSSSILGVPLVVSCLILGVFFGQPSAGQPPAAPAKPVGPYQAVPVGSYIVVLDPATGQCWARLVQDPQLRDDPKVAWVSLGTPVQK